MHSLVDVNRSQLQIFVIHLCAFRMDWLDIHPAGTHPSFQSGRGGSSGISNDTHKSSFIGPL